MMIKIPARVHVAFLFLFTFFAVAESAMAQFGSRGGGRSRGGDRNSPFRVLFEEDYEREFNLTEDQRGKLEQLEEELRPGEGEQLDFRNLPQDEAERAAYIAEFRKKGEARNAEAMTKIKSLLQENQYQRLEQLRYQRLGVAALGTEQVSADLKLSDQQKSDVTKLAEEYQAARMQMFRLRGEEREQAEQEWNDKFLAVLSPDQKAAWQTKLGPPPADEEEQPAPSATTTTDTTPAPAAARGTYTPADEEGPVVVSLAGPEGAASEETATAEKPGATPRAEKDELIQFHLENAPWEMVLKRFAKKAGLTLQIMDLPPGSLTYTNDDKRYTPTEALDILHGYLLQKGYVMIKRDRFLVVLSLDAPGGIPPNLIPSISISDLEVDGKHGKHEILSVVLPLEGADANDAAREVESLKGPQGSVVPLSVSNSLVVTDTFANLKRIHNLLKGVTNVDPEQQQFKSFPLEYILAEEAAIIVRDQLGLELTTSSSNRSRIPFSFQGSSNSNSSTSSRSRTGSSTSSAPAAPAKVTPDPRTNRLLITATPNQLAIAEQILTNIDIVADRAMDNRPYLHVYHLKLADIDEVRRTLDAIMPGLVVGEDEDRDGGRIHIKATPRQHQQVAEEIAKMDGASSLTSAVIPLRSYDPASVTTMLNGLFYSDGDLAPTIMAESTGRRLIVRGSNEQIAEIRKFLSDLGEDGDGASQDVDRGPLRMRSLGGRDPEEFARILEQVWGNRSERPIRVVIPSSNPIRDRVVPSLPANARNPFLDDLRPSTSRPPRAADLDQKSTATERKRLYDVSLLEEKTEPAKAETAADETKEKNGETEASEAAAADLPVFPAEVTLRITRAGDWLLNGKPTSAIELSKFASGWLKAIPANERRFTFSTHPETPTAVSFGALGVLQRSGVDPTLKMSADDGDAANNQQTSANAGRQPSVATGSGKLPITLTVRGGDLMLFDPTGKSESLDEMEAIIEQLALAIPPRTTWTVYYLRSADCTETATMLEQLFPSSSVSDGNVGDDGSFFGGLTNSISSLGGSLVDAAGLNTLTASSSVLRIIPEVRSNSLFVSGPIDQVNQVEDMLRVLDADELPETLRDRVPRTIPVKYANVSDVHNQVKELYKDYMQDERQQQQGRNPLEMMMGGGRSSGGNTRSGGRSSGGRGASTVRMTLAVDTQTSELIVSASDALFQQVKAMVEERDLAAKQAERSMQIVGVNEANSAVLQQALTAMLPSVNVSTTSSSDSNRGSSGGDSQRPSWGSSGSSFDRSRYFNNSNGSSRPTFGGGDSGRSFGGSSRGSFGGGDSGRSFGGSSRGSFGGGDSGRSFGTSTRGGFGGDSGRSSFGGSSRGGFGGGDSGRSFGGSSRGGSSGRSFGGRGR